jgi:hypothetical protein
VHRQSAQPLVPLPPDDITRRVTQLTHAVQRHGCSILRRERLCHHLHRWQLEVHASEWLGYMVLVGEVG